MFLAGSFADLTHDYQARMNANPYRQANALVLFQTRIESAHGLNNPKPCVYSPLCIILVCLRLAEIDHEAIAKVLGDVAIVMLNDLGTGELIGAYYVA